jgi:hypothetical protein
MKEREEKVAREKKEREEKLARKILFILQNKSSKVLLKFIRSCAEKNKLMKNLISLFIILGILHIILISCD